MKAGDKESEDEESEDEESEDEESEDEESEDEESGGKNAGNRTKNPAEYRQEQDNTHIMRSNRRKERRGAKDPRTEDSGGITPGTEQKEGSISECSCSGF